ncbi:MAG: hypothetical protein ACKOPS_04345, partial [Cyanobium sp.]
MQRPARQRSAGPLTIAAALCLLMGPSCLAAPKPGNKPYDTLLTELERILRDLENFDAIVAAPTVEAPAKGSEWRLPAPAALAIPQGSPALTVRARVRLTLPQALALAVKNSPAVAQSVADVQRERAMLRAAWGRYAPTLSLSLGALGGQRLERNEALIGNASIYPSSSPF